MSNPSDKPADAHPMIPDPAAVSGGVAPSGDKLQSAVTASGVLASGGAPVGTMVPTAIPVNAPHKLSSNGATSAAAGCSNASVVVSAGGAADLSACTGAPSSGALSQPEIVSSRVISVEPLNMPARHGMPMYNTSTSFHASRMMPSYSISGAVTQRSIGSRMCGNSSAVRTSSATPRASPSYVHSGAVTYRSTMDGSGRPYGPRHANGPQSQQNHSTSIENNAVAGSVSGAVSTTTGNETTAASTTRSSMPGSPKVGSYHAVLPQYALSSQPVAAMAGDGMHQQQQHGVLLSDYGSRIMRGDAVVVGTNSYVDESRAHVMSERVTETEVRVPKRILREDIIEKVIVIPERQLREEVVEEIVKVRQKIIEMAKPVIQETIVEIPEIEFVERLVEYPEIVTQEKIREVPRIEVQENIIEIPRIIRQEKIVEVPEIEYLEIPIEKIVEVPEFREQVVVREVRVPHYVEKPVPEYVDVELPREVQRSVPVPLEATVDLVLQLPKVRPRYTRVDVPLYVPRFVEVAVPVEMMDERMVANADHYAQQVHFLASQSAASLCELEKLGGSLKNADTSSFLHAFATTTEMCRFFGSTWASGRLAVASTTPRLTTRSAGTAHSTSES